MIKYKKGVKIGCISPQIVLALQVVNDIYSKYNIDCVVTSVCDSKHSTYSQHYEGNAVDLRVRNIPIVEARTSIFKQIEENLPQGFMLIDEGTHFHLAWKPKYGEA